MYAVLISLLQEKLIYMPRSYSGRHSKYYKQRRMKTNQKLISIGSRKIINLKYTIANGMSQTAYFLPPPTSMKTNNEMEEDTTPFHLWMTSSGNAGLGLRLRCTGRIQLQEGSPFTNIHQKVTRLRNGGKYD